MKIIAANNASTILAAAISSTATTLSVSSGSGSQFPLPVAGTSYFKLTLTDAATESLNEIVHVTAVSGDVFTIVRGQEGTAARTWSVSDRADNMITAGTIAAMAQYDTAEFISATSGRLVNIQVITASGTYTPTSGAKKAQAIITGAGAGASGCTAVNTTTGIFSGAGGGAGATAIHYFNITDGSYAAAVGIGGDGGLGQVAGVAGGLSSLNGVTANGGQPGGAAISARSSAGGAGGLASGGIMNVSGGIGSDGQLGDYLICGDGGSSYWGGGGRSGNAGGADGAAYGSGGGGAYDVGFTNTAYRGGKGANGVIIIYEYQ